MEKYEATSGGCCCVQCVRTQEVGTSLSFFAVCLFVFSCESSGGGDDDDDVFLTLFALLLDVPL